MTNKFIKIKIFFYFYLKIIKKFINLLFKIYKFYNLILFKSFVSIIDKNNFELVLSSKKQNKNGIKFKSSKKQK